MPTLIGNGYSSIAPCEFHSLALKNDSSLWAWGANFYGALGDGTTTQRLAPTLISGGYSAVSCGYGHSLALKNDGTLWAWGDNAVGQLGDGTTTDRLVPTLIGTGYTAIAAGDYHSLALKNDGSLWAWGRNGFGQLGDGTFTQRLVPTLVGTGYTATAAGDNHSYGLKNDSSLWAWGNNNYGVLGDGTTTSRSVPTLIFSDGFTFATHELVVATTGDGIGSVMSEPPGIDCGTECRAEFSNGAEITLTPVADVNAMFNSWSGACSGAEIPCVVTLDATKYVTANFSPGTPDINVRGNELEILDGDTIPTIADDTEFGTADVTDGTVTHTFTIANAGTAALNLTGTPYVRIGGAHASDFEITLQPTSPVPPGGSTTFQVRFNPSAEGLRQAIISIANDDGDEDPYDFSIQGTGTVAMDTDGDGLSDQEEADIYGTDPMQLDTDGDGLGDGTEAGVVGFDADPLTTTDPLDPDTDGDGHLDGDNGVDPCEDCDNNGLVDAGETDPDAPDAFVHLDPGLNLFSYPGEVPSEHRTCNALAEVLGGSSSMVNIARLDSVTGLWEECDTGAGMDFPIVTGEAYSVYAQADVAMVWPWSSVCPVRTLEGGANLVGHPAPMGLTCFNWLTGQDAETVSSIQGFNPDNGRFETCALLSQGEAEMQAVGVDFPIRAAQGYLFNAIDSGLVVYPGCP